MSFEIDIKNRIAEASSRFISNLIVDGNSPPTEDIEKFKEDSLIDQIHKSFTFAEGTLEFEWIRFIKQSETILKSWSTELTTEIVKSLSDENKNEVDSISEWFEPWQIKKCYQLVSSIQNVDIQDQHMRAFAAGDRQICDHVKFDIMNLYDQSVIERIWKADLCADQYFFKMLGEAIQGYVKGPTERRNSGDPGYNLVTNVLCELHRMGFVDLVTSVNNAGSSEEWVFARNCIKLFMQDCPRLLKSAYIEKKDRFLEQFTPEFDITKIEKSDLTKYQFENRFNRLRTRQWLHIPS